jgi:hypothetical protein
MLSGPTGWPMRFREQNVAWSLKARESSFPKSARKNSIVNCAASGNKLNNDETALPPMFWQDGSDGSRSSGSRFKFARPSILGAMDSDAHPLLGMSCSCALKSIPKSGLTCSRSLVHSAESLGNPFVPANERQEERKRNAGLAVAAGLLLAFLLGE